MSARLEINLAAKPKSRPTAAPVQQDSYLPLKAGKKYLLANGDVVGPLLDYNSAMWMKWRDPATGKFRYWQIGTGYHYGGPQITMQIVKEYIEELTTAEAAVLWDAGETIQYRIGDSKVWSQFPKKSMGWPSSPNLYSKEWHWRKAQ